MGHDLALGDDRPMTGQAMNGHFNGSPSTTRRRCTGSCRRAPSQPPRRIRSASCSDTCRA